MGYLMVMEHTLFPLLVVSMLVSGRMDFQMVKEQKLFLMDTSMMVNGRTEYQMVKELQLSLMDTSM